MHSDFEITKLLLENGANLLDITKSEEILCEKKAKLLMDNGVKGKDLSYGLFSSNVKLVDFLMKNGVDVNIERERGGDIDAPLSYSIRCQNLDVFLLLLKSGKCSTDVLHCKPRYQNVTVIGWDPNPNPPRFRSSGDESLFYLLKDDVLRKELCMSKGFLTIGKIFKAKRIANLKRLQPENLFNETYCGSRMKRVKMSSSFIENVLQ